MVKDMMLREMRISSFSMDPRTNKPIVVLKDTKNETTLLFRTGLWEATAIAAGVEQIQFLQPLTHDLVRNLLHKLGVTVERIEVHDYRNRIFYTWIYVRANGRQSRIDSRLCDALAIASRTNAPIYMNEEVLGQLSKFKVEGKAEILEEEAKKWTDILQSLSPEDFGKYSM